MWIVVVQGSVSWTRYTLNIQYILIYQKNLNILNTIMDNKGTIMQNKQKKEPCSPTKNQPLSCCKVESVVSIDERGQMVLPKDLREKAGIKAGDKLAVISMEKNGKVCCLSLLKVGDIEPMVKNMLGPIMKEIL
jgi:antitoxin PrlF